MKIFILFITLTILFSYFATTNALLVPIQLGPYALNFPLSLAILLPLGMGLLVFTLIYLAKIRRLKFISKQDNDEINELQNNITQLNKKIHELQLENKKIKTRLGDKSFNDESI